MHRFFYRCLPGFSVCTPVVRIVLGLTLGMCLGSILCFSMPQPGLDMLAKTLLGSTPDLGRRITVPLLPVAFAAVLLALGAEGLALVGIPGFAGMLMTFSALTFGAVCPKLGVFLLMLGRGLGLVVLFWFLLCGERKNRRMLAAESFLCGALTVLVIVFADWLTAPGIQVLIGND